MLNEMQLKGLRIPVIVMSGYSPATQETLSQFPFVKAVVPKPFRPEQILQLVGKVLENSLEPNSTERPLPNVAE